MAKQKNIIYLYIQITVFVIVSSIVSAHTLFGQSIRLDESQSLWISTKTILAIVQYISLDVHVPLYELILHIWLQLFGVSIIAARSLSLLFFLISVPILYKLTMNVTNRTMALLTIGLYSLSPFIVWYSYEARMYSLFTLVTCISHYYFTKLVRTHGEEGMIGYFFSTLFGLYTHYFFVLLLVSQFLFFIINLMQTDRRYTYRETPSSFWSRNRKDIISFISPSLLAIGLFTPWVIYFFLQGFAANTQPFIPPPTTYNIFQTIINFLFGLQSQAVQSILAALWPLAVIPLFFLFSRRTITIQFDYIFYFILTTVLPIILLFLASYYRPLFLPRYLILVTPSFFMLLTWSLFQMSKGASRLVISFVAFIMFAFLLYQNTSVATPVMEDYAGVIGFLEKQVTDRDIITTSAPFTIYPVMYYYNGPIRITTIPEWNLYKTGPIPAYSNTKLSLQIKTYGKTYQHLYLILSYDQGYQKNITQYLDTHYQRLLLRYFSPGLELREYKLQY